MSSLVEQANATARREREVPSLIDGPGKYRFEKSGFYFNFQYELETFISRNFPGILQVNFYRAHLDNLGHYVDADLTEEKAYKKDHGYFSYDEKYLKWRGFSDPEYYQLKLDSRLSGNSRSGSLVISDTGELFIGENKLEVGIADTKLDGKFQVSSSGTVNLQGYETPRLLQTSGRITLEGDNPGSFIKAAKEFINMQATKGMPLWRIT